VDGGVTAAGPRGFAQAAAMHATPL
jgi:hypothetical protein